MEWICCSKCDRVNHCIHVHVFTCMLCCVPPSRTLLGPRARLSSSEAVVYVGGRVRPVVHVLRRSLKRRGRGIKRCRKCPPLLWCAFPHLQYVVVKSLLPICNCRKIWLSNQPFIIIFAAITTMITCGGHFLKIRFLPRTFSKLGLGD